MPRARLSTRGSASKTRSSIRHELPISPSVPSLTVTEGGGLVQLQFGTFARGSGASLQEAADDLVRSLLRVVLAVRSSGFRGSCELQPDVETMDFLYELGEIAAAGGDIRARVFG